MAIRSGNEEIQVNDILEFNVHDVTNFSKTTLEVLLTCMLRKTTNIDLVRLDSRK